MASREAMNMGSRSSTVISEFKSVIASLGQATDSAFNKLNSASVKVSGGGGGGGGGGGSGTLVAPNPVFSSAPQISQLTETGHGLVQSGGQVIGQGSNLVARGPSNLSNHAAQTGSASLYQPELGSISRGGSGGSGVFGGKGGGAGGNNSGGNPFSNLTNLPIIGGSLAAGQAFYNTVSNLTPSTSDVLESQLLQQRASFFTGGKSKVEANIGKSIGGIQTSQAAIAQLGMLSGDNPQMDVMRAQVAAQGYGLGSSMDSIMKSAANVSNLMPGLGVEGSVRATAAMQQGNSVNMLRGIGIQLRGPDGQMKGPDQVIEDIWKKICRDYSQAYGASKSPSLKEVQIALQPGNSIDSMLNQYFGGDPMLKQLVANGLLYKAQGGTSFDSKGNGVMKEGVAALGGTTDAMLSYSSTAAAGQGFLVSGQAGAESGFMTSNAKIEEFYQKSGTAAALSIAKAFSDTLLTAFGGNPLTAMIGLSIGGSNSDPKDLRNILNMFTAPGAAAGSMGNLIAGMAGNTWDLFKDLLGGIMPDIPGMATGGEVTSGAPYIIGEKGPELFVPSSNGTIVPNHALGAAGGSYTYNITVTAASGNTQDLVTEIKNVLTQIETNRRVSEA